METLVKEDMGEVHRTLLCQGPVELTRGTKMKKRHLSLFNDVLVVSNNLKKRKFKIKYIIPLNYLCAMDDVNIVNLVRKNEICACKTLALFWPTGNFLATFRSKEQKDHWYYFLKRSVNEAKMGIQKNFKLQIFTEDIPNCDSPLCVTATNIDTVDDIIMKLLPMMRIPNSVDYQLWFRPGHGEAPRALKGYEYPHEALMTDLQHTYSRLNSKHSTAFPILPGLFGKDLNLEEEGQFILTPRYSAISQQQNAKERLHNKQRAYRTSCFHRGSVPHQDQVCPVPTVKKKGKLFGKELSSICNDGKWPTAILDILSLLREKGPTTEGIFNVSPDEQLCKTVKDKLDSGQKVNIRKYSMHVVASILKDFLQSIKGSILTSQYYEHWLAIPQMVNDEDKFAAVKSLLEKLPPSNAAFLRQLFRILNKIAGKSSVNQMTSYSLSTVLAPFILYLPSYRNQDLAHIAEKISLITFLINNSPRLFGEDIVALWYETSFYHLPRENTSCVEITPSNISNVNETKDGVSSCPKERTYTPHKDEPTISPVAPPQSEGIIESENRENNMNATQQATSQTPPAPMKKQGFRTFPPFLCLDKMLPSILDMLSIIAEKGQESDEIFLTIPARSQWALRNKMHREQLINWNEESVLTVAFVLKDFIRNIKGSLLSSDLYENWLSVLDEDSRTGKISAIQSILPKMPQANYLLLKQLIRVLLKIATSAKNTLDSFLLSMRIAPHMLWDQTCVNSLFGSDMLKKMSVTQIMIDNYAVIFGDDDNIICDNSQKTSDDIKTSVNTAAGDNETTPTYDVPQEKLPHN